MAVKTTAIKAWRESEVPSGAKSDPGDADVIADYLRVRHQPLRVLAPFCDATKALRTVVRVRDDLVDQRVAAINQLAALLDAFWPGAKAIFADVESPTALSFLERYPTPASAARLGDKRMAAFCAKVRYSGGRTPAELLERLRGAPAGIADAAGTAAAGDAVLAMVTVLRALNAAIKDLERSIQARLAGHPDGEVFTSCRAQGWSTPRKCSQSGAIAVAPTAVRNQVTALAGQTPVTKQSGKHTSIGFRWSCNKRFRNAMHTFADNSRHASPWAAGVYADAKTRGHDHQHALASLAAHGSGSSTAAGPMASPTTPHSTAQPAGSPPQRSQTNRLQRRG